MRAYSVTATPVGTSRLLQRIPTHPQLLWMGQPRYGLTHVTVLEFGGGTQQLRTRQTQVSGHWPIVVRDRHCNDYADAFWVLTPYSLVDSSNSLVKLAASFFKRADKGDKVLRTGGTRLANYTSQP
jgi:hypothetical protein